MQDSEITELEKLRDQLAKALDSRLEFRKILKQILAIRKKIEIDITDWDDVYYQAAFTGLLWNLKLLLRIPLFFDYPNNLLLSGINSESPEIVESILKYEDTHIPESKRFPRSMAYVYAETLKSPAWKLIMEKLLISGAKPDDLSLVDWIVDDKFLEQTQWIQEHFSFPSQSWGPALNTAVRNHQWKILEYLLSVIQTQEPDQLPIVMDRHVSTRLGMENIKEFQFIRNKFT